MTTKTLFAANDKLKAALAARRAPTAAQVFAPKPAPPNNRVENGPSDSPKQAEDRIENEPDLSALNPAQIAGRARRAAQRERQHRAALVRERLIREFPLCFKPSGEKTPLKIGIDRDIAAVMPEISKNDIGLALKSYCWEKSYRQAVVEGAMRVDLDGVATGLVTAQEAWPPNNEKPPADEAGG
jgi:hypothetical protein